MRIIVLGAGLVGGAIAQDLAGDDDLQVTVADYSQANLDKLKEESKIKKIKTDLSDSTVVSKLVKESDLVIE